MTFTEAAIEVLRREGKPLHFTKIAEIAIRESLLDHVGKIPDDTMADQLVAHCRLPHTDRRVIPILNGTFALVEWGMDEDPKGLDDLVETPPEDEPAYRGRERHPVPSHEIARGTGRGEGRRRREEEGPRQRRFPPPAEVAYEILAGATRPLALLEIAAQGTERLLMPEAFVRDGNALRAALQEDNRRRESNGRRALFDFSGDTVTLLAQPEPGERPAVPLARAPVSPGEVRRAGLAALRRRLRDCDGPTVEHLLCLVLEKLGFRELKVAKRGREHVIYTGRRRMGLSDVRHGIRILRNSGEVSRRDVTELRRDLGHYGAQLGMVVSAGEAAREARGEASAAGQLPVILLCGEALPETFAEVGVGCVQVVVPEVDEAFFRTAAEAAEQEEAARRARREERDRRDGRDGRRREERSGEDRSMEERSGLLDEPGSTVSVAAGAEPAEPIFEEAEEPPERAREPQAILVDATLDDAEADLDEEGPEGEEVEVEVEAVAEVSALASAGGAAAPAAGGTGEAGPGGERRRRRRRRRRRGGRGRGREGAPGDGASPAGLAASQSPGSPPPPASAEKAEEPSAPPAQASAPAPEPPPGGGTSE